MVTMSVRAGLPVTGCGVRRGDLVRAVIAPRHRASAVLLAATLCATARIAHADCPEGTPQAACVPHEEQPPPEQPPPEQPPPVMPSPVTPPPLPSTTLAIGMTVLSPGPDLPGVSLGPGVGLFGLFERRAGKSLGLTFRADYISHPTDNSKLGQFSGFEVMALAGLRTMTRTLHARIEAGVTISTIEAVVQPPADPGASGTVSWTDIYPVIGIGGGLHVGRVRLHASVLYAANFAADPISTGHTPQMPIRFMGVLGVDLWRR